MWYIKGEKRTWDAKELGGRNFEAPNQQRNQNTIHVREKAAFKPTIRPLEHFTPLSSRREQIL